MRRRDRREIMWSLSAGRYMLCDLERGTCEELYLAFEPPDREIRVPYVNAIPIGQGEPWKSFETNAEQK